jgi:hypothetical protein
VKFQFRQKNNPVVYRCGSLKLCALCVNVLSFFSRSVAVYLESIGRLPETQKFG